MGGGVVNGIADTYAPRGQLHFAAIRVISVSAVSLTQLFKISLCDP